MRSMDRGPIGSRALLPDGCLLLVCKNARDPALGEDSAAVVWSLLLVLGWAKDEGGARRV